MRTSIGCVLLIGMASCQEPAAPKRPAEVPIQEYRVEGPAPEIGAADVKEDAGAVATTSATTKPSEGKSEGTPGLAT